MLRHVLVLASFCASFFVQPTLAAARHRQHAASVASHANTVAPAPQVHWTDALVCGVAAYLPPAARWCNDAGTIAWRRFVGGTRTWARSVVDEYRRVMTEV